MSFQKLGHPDVVMNLMTVYLCCGAGESSDEMFLVRGDVQGRW